MFPSGFNKYLQPISIQSHLNCQKCGLQGKDKLKDVFYAYQEMIDKYGATPLLLVAQSSTLIQQQKYQEAEKLLLVSLNLIPGKLYVVIPHYEPL